MNKARLGWVVVGLVLLVSACGASGGVLQTPAIGEAQSVAPTATEVVAAAEAASTQDVATETLIAVVEVTPTETVPTATEAPEATVPASPTAVEMAPTEAPAATAAHTPTQAAMVPAETPTVNAEATPDDVVQTQANTTPGPSEEQLQLLASLNDYGPAPQWHNDVWLNSEPLTLADLQGKVVLVEFWTFG